MKIAKWAMHLAQNSISYPAEAAFNATDFAYTGCIEKLILKPSNFTAFKSRLHHYLISSRTSHIQLNYQSITVSAFLNPLVVRSRLYPILYRL